MMSSSAPTGSPISDPWPGAIDCDGWVEDEEAAQARQVLDHVAVGRRDDHGRPLHDVVPREEHPLLDEQPAQVVGGVPRGVQGPKREALAPQLEAFTDVAGGDETVAFGEAEHLGAGARRRDRRHPEHGRGGCG